MSVLCRRQCDVVSFQLLPQGQCFALAHFVEQSPKAWAVVHLNQMCELMLHDVVLQMTWQKGEVEGEVDVALHAATAPAFFG